MSTTLQSTLSETASLATLADTSVTRSTSLDNGHFRATKKVIPSLPFTCSLFSVTVGDWFQYYNPQVLQCVGSPYNLCTSSHIL